MRADGQVGELARPLGDLSKRVGGPGASVRRRRSGCGVAIGLPQRRIRPLTAGGRCRPTVPERRRRSHRGKVKRDPVRSSAAPVDRLRALGPPPTIRADGQLSGAVGPALPHPRQRSRAAAPAGVESRLSPPRHFRRDDAARARGGQPPTTGEGPDLVDEPCTGGWADSAHRRAGGLPRGQRREAAAGQPGRSLRREFGGTLATAVLGDPPGGMSAHDDHPTDVRRLPRLAGGQSHPRAGPLRRQGAVLAGAGPPGDQRGPVRPGGVLLRPDRAAARPGRSCAVPARQLRPDGPAPAPQAADPGQPGVHAEGGGRPRAAHRRADQPARSTRSGSGST